MLSRQLKTFLLCLGYYLRQALFLNQTLVLQTFLVTVQAISALQRLFFLQALGPFQQEQLHGLLFCHILKRKLGILLSRGAQGRRAAPVGSQEAICGFHFTVFLKLF